MTAPQIQIRDIALDVLMGLSAATPWMTARSLVWRIRKNPKFKDLQQSQLNKILFAEANLGVGLRKIRNSSLPSPRTLEVLWGAISDGHIRDKEVESPLLHRCWGQLATIQNSDEGGEEDEEEGALTCFLSYNLGDSSAIENVVRSLEYRGHSVWYAGREIESGEHINSSVIESLRNAQQHFLYLSEASFRSLWVGKEIIVGQDLQLDLTIILDGSKPDFTKEIFALAEENALLA